MAGRSRVQMNREALSEIRGGLADGVFELGRAIEVVAASRAPDSPYDPYPEGKGLPEQGGTLVFVEGQRTHEHSDSGKRPDLPRGVGVRTRGGIIGVVGFGFPGMFAEAGTVHHGAQPFLTPAAVEVIGEEAEIILSKAMERRLRGERSAKTMVIREKIAAARERSAARSVGGEG